MKAILDTYHQIFIASSRIQMYNYCEPNSLEFIGGEMAKETHKPGEKAKDSGQYPIVGPRGGDTGKERTVTKGEPFPPTPKKGQEYGTPDKTKH